MVIRVDEQLGSALTKSAILCELNRTGINSHHKSNSISFPITEMEDSEMKRPGQRWFEVDDHGRTRNGRSVTTGIQPS
jgi:hypothetical protein